MAPSEGSEGERTIALKRGLCKFAYRCLQFDDGLFKYWMVNRQAWTVRGFLYTCAFRSFSRRSLSASSVSRRYLPCTGQSQVGKAAFPENGAAA